MGSQIQLSHVMPPPAAPNGCPSHDSSGQQDLPVSQAGPPSLSEALAGALVEEQAGGSLKSHRGVLCNITGPGQNSLG